MLYLMTEGFGPTVIDSQVIDLLAALGRRGRVIDLLALVGARDWLHHRSDYEARRKANAQRLSGKVRMRPTIRPSDLRLAPANAAYVASAAPNLLRGPSIVHARGHAAASIAARLRRLNPALQVIYDVRGDAVAEVDAFAPANRRSAERARIAAVVHDAVHSASAILTVSQTLADHLISTFGAPAHLIQVVPCLASAETFHFDETKRAARRRALGLQDALVFTFAGSTGRWHFLEPTLALVRALIEQEPRAHFLALSPNEADVRRACEAMLPPGRFTVTSAPHSEMPEWLCAADAGLLLREQHPINAVASPTKFAEYALVGLPTLLTAGIGDYSRWATEQAFGFIVDAQTPTESASQALAWLKSRPQEPRQNTGARAAEALSKESHLPRIEALYAGLLPPHASAQTSNNGPCGPSSRA